MLFEMAIADAYGIGFEFCPKSPDRPNDLKRYHQHPQYKGLKPGQYTDDTQRALANAEVLFKGDPYSVGSYAEYYLEVLRRDPRDGYSRNYQKFLEKTKDSEEFIKTIKRTKASNGSIMGVAPLGYLRTINEVMTAATVQAITTHSAETIVPACWTALAAHYFIYDLGNKAGLRDFLNLHVHWDEPIYPFPDLVGFPVDYSRGIEMQANDTFFAVLTALHEHDNLADIIQWCCECGGDTDSAAAVAVAIASCSEEFKDNIPNPLIFGLENGTYGTEYLIEMDDALYQFAHPVF